MIKQTNPVWNINILEYGTRFSKMPGEKTNLFYGVELEVEPKALFKHITPTTTSITECAKKVVDEIGTLVNVRGDCSVSFGFEIVSVPATLRFHKEVLWKDFFDNSGKELKATDATGLHIHFSRDALTTKQLAKCIYFVHETGNSGFLSAIAGRRVYSEAKWAKQRKKIYKKGQENTLINEETGQRGALGISSHFNGTTCEMRIFKSNPTKAGVLQALEFVDAMITYCGDCPNDEQALTHMAFKEWFSFSGIKDSYPYLYDNMLLHGFVAKPKGWRVLMQAAG